MTFHDFFSISFSPVNTVLSVLLIFSVLYWIFTIITGIDMDVGIDADPGTDFNSLDTHVDIPEDPSAWMQFLKFLNLDIVPLAYFLTLSLLFTWLGSVYLHAFFVLPVWLSALMTVPLSIVAVLLTKTLLKPLNPFFREINHKGESPHDFLGREGRLKSSIHGDKIGIMEVFIGSDPITLMVKSSDGKKLDHGMKVMIVDEAPDRKFFYVDHLFNFKK